MHWDTKLRYRSYVDWSDDYLAKLKSQVDQSIWRLNYHIQAPHGLLNDPNGFSYYAGKWHLFYQYFPFGAVHGNKAWFHLTSENLVDWVEQGIALKPDTIYDSHGVYSGSAIPVANHLLIAYTGNVRNQAWEREAYQMYAVMDRSGKITKQLEPFLQTPAGFTAHFRDPQIVYFHDRYLLVIGGQTDAEKGQILLFQSDDLVAWEYLGPLAMNGQINFGYMVECPNLLLVDGKIVLHFCPQGLSQKDLLYQNVYPNCYVLADDLDLEKLELVNPSKLQLLDEGFDLYATQSFTAPNGQTFSIGWMGLPEMTYPNFTEGWAHQLSLIKQMKVVNKRLYQFPLKELTRRAKNRRELKNRIPQKTANVYHLRLQLTPTCQGRLQLFADPTLTRYLEIRFANGQLELDRSHSEHILNPEYGVTRTFSVAELLQLDCFVDQSSCELFINNGEKVASLCYYPLAGDDYLQLNYQGPVEALLEDMMLK